MKSITLFIFLFTSAIITAQSELIATINDNSYQFQIDTLKLKQRLSKELFNEEIQFNKIEIKSELENDNFYYFIQLLNANQKIRIVRWLVLKNEELFFESELTENNEFVKTYVTCIGECSPKVITIEKQKYWSCDGSNNCTNTEQNQSLNLICKKIAASILD